MRSLILIVCLLVIGINFCSAQISYVIKTNTTNFFQGKMGVAYEQRLDGKTSFLIEPVYQFSDRTKSGEFEFKRTFQLNLEYRKFLASLLRDAPKKFYAGLSASVEHQNLQNKILISDTFTDEDFFRFGLGFVFGNQYISRKNIAIDIFANPVLKLSNNLSDEEAAFEVKVVVERIGISVGLAFR